VVANSFSTHALHSAIQHRGRDAGGSAVRNVRVAAVRASLRRYWLLRPAWRETLLPCLQRAASTLPFAHSTSCALSCHYLSLALFIGGCLYLLPTWKGSLGVPLSSSRLNLYRREHVCRRRGSACGRWRRASAALQRRRCGSGAPPVLRGTRSYAAAGRCCLRSIYQPFAFAWRLPPGRLARFAAAAALRRPALPTPFARGRRDGDARRARATRTAPRALPRYCAYCYHATAKSRCLPTAARTAARTALHAPPAFF